MDEAKRLLLSQEEKASMRLNVIKFMRHEALGRDEQAQNVPPTKARFVMSFAALRKPALQYGMLALAVCVFSGAGVAFASQNSLPGDLLYPVKTGVTEKLVKLAIISEEKRVEYEVSLVQKRLAEAETVASKNKLNARSGAQVSFLLDSHIADVKNLAVAISKRKSADAAVEINSELEAQLNSYAQVLGKLAARGQGDSSSVALENIVVNLKDKATKTLEGRHSQEARLMAQTEHFQEARVSAKLQEAARAIERASQSLAARTPDIAEGTYQKAEFEILSAQEKIASGKAQLEAGDLAGAFVSFQDALRLAREVHLYVAHEAALKHELGIVAPQNAAAAPAPDAASAQDGDDDDGDDSGSSRSFMDKGILDVLRESNIFK